ncbi:Helicase superfamily 1/2, DinG/Rad3-like protein, partial [Aduncisulcus paluster]
SKGSSSDDNEDSCSSTDDDPVEYNGKLLDLTCRSMCASGQCSYHTTFTQNQAQCSLPLLCSEMFISERDCLAREGDDTGEVTLIELQKKRKASELGGGGGSKSSSSKQIKGIGIGNGRFAALDLLDEMNIGEGVGDVNSTERTAEEEQLEWEMWECAGGGGTLLQRMKRKRDKDKKKKRDTAIRAQYGAQYGAENIDRQYDHQNVHGDEDSMSLPSFIADDTACVKDCVDIFPDIEDVMVRQVDGGGRVVVHTGNKRPFGSVMSELASPKYHKIEEDRKKVIRQWRFVERKRVHEQLREQMRRDMDHRHGAIDDEDDIEKYKGRPIAPDVVPGSSVQSIDAVHMNPHPLLFSPTPSYLSSLLAHPCMFGYSPHTVNSLRSTAMGGHVNVNKQFCPYRMSRHLSKSSDLILCPYNYLLSPSIRDGLGWRLKDAVVVFDEAHNLAHAARDAASGDILPTVVSDLSAIDDMIFKEGRVGSVCRFLPDLQKFIHTCYKMVETAGRGSVQSSRPKRGRYGGSWGGKRRSTGSSSFSSNPEQMLKTDELADALAKHPSLSVEPLTALIGEIQSAMEKEGPDDSVSGGKRRRKPFFTIRLAVKAIQEGKWSKRSLPPIILQSLMDTFSLLLLVARNKEHYGLVFKDAPGTTSPSLSFVCLSASVILKPLASQVRCIILASGTLGKHHVLRSELGINIHNFISADHVIDKEKQLDVRVAGHEELVLNYQSLQNSDKFIRISKILANTIHSYSVNVRGGTLLFFPSYPMMLRILKQWSISGDLRKLMGGRFLLCEREIPGINYDLDKCMMGKDPGKMMKKLRRITEKENGSAVFFAVCRGKAAEGMDFAHSMSRCVGIVGIPFPAAKDPQVIMKRTYNDHIRSTKDRFMCSGSEWYFAEAFKAVGQALGRAIRSRFDYGSLLLLDRRYSQSNMMGGLPAWVQPRVRTDRSQWNRHGGSLISVDLFLKNAEQHVKMLRAEFNRGKLSKKSLHPSSKLHVLDDPSKGIDTHAHSHLGISTMPHSTTSPLDISPLHHNGAQVHRDHIPSTSTREASHRGMDDLDDSMERWLMQEDLGRDDDAKPKGKQHTKTLVKGDIEIDQRDKEDKSMSDAVDFDFNEDDIEIDLEKELAGKDDAFAMVSSKQQSTKAQNPQSHLSKSSATSSSLYPPPKPSPSSSNPSLHVSV